MLVGTKCNSWKMINQRNVTDLVSVEFLHDLYNQYKPMINIARFRETICIWHNSIFQSFAPSTHWDFLARHLGGRLLRDHVATWKGIESHLVRDKKCLFDLLHQIEDVPAKSAIEAFEQLVDLQAAALDQIYGINLVQIEHAVQFALRELVKLEYPSESADVVIAEICRASEHTMAVSEEILLLKAYIFEEDLNLRKQFELEFKSSFVHLYSAYGAECERVSMDHKIDAMRGYSKQEALNRLHKLESGLNHKSSVSMSPKLDKIASLARRVGVLRDKNKALMGHVSALRSSILDKIALFTSTCRQDLRWYLLSEIEILAFDREQLDAATKGLRESGMVLRRSEIALAGDDSVRFWLTNVSSHVITENEFIGVCAARGNVRGIVRHVQSAADLEKIGEDSILVARGTDFDLISGMMRCAGIICEEGGILSHAAVISRELHKPCIIGVSSIFAKIPDGTTIEMNATSGKVIVLSSSAICENNESIHNSSHSGVPRPKMLSEIHADAKYGAKARCLAMIAKVGLPVLPGVVISTHDVSTYSPDVLAKSILTMAQSEGWAYDRLIVRSSSMNEDSAHQSAAGIFISTNCGADKNSLAEAIRQVRESANHDSALRYSNLITQQSSMAILIQPYHQQTLGGVLFTRDPTTGSDTIVVEMGNSAENVVEGKVIERKEWKRIVVPVDTNSIEFKLHRLAMRAESLFGMPIDMEWGSDGDDIIIYQVRPITTLNMGVVFQ